MNSDNYFEIDGHVIKIDNTFEVEVCIHSKRNPEVVFKIKTKFWARRFNDNNNNSSYLYLEKYPRGHQLNQFEVKKQNGLILIHNIETKMRICRIPIDFMDEVIDKCNKLVTACLNEPRIGVSISHKDNKTININLNSAISFSLNCDSSLRPGYLSFSEDKYFADWMTLLEYENIPNYKILVMKRIDTFSTIEV